MTVVFGTLTDVGGQLAQGTVTVSSLVTRPAHGAASTVITKERHVLPLRNGAFESPELDPGPVLVEATPGARLYEVLPVPADHQPLPPPPGIPPVTPPRQPPNTDSPVVEAAPPGPGASLDGTA